MTERRGGVWYGDRRVGEARAGDGGRLRFRYAAEWLDDGFPISLTLPLSSGTDELDAHPFFEGLLPEGGARRRLCRQYRLSEDDDAGLLFAIGEDCAGALSILPDVLEPETLGGEPTPISQEDLARIVESQGQSLPTSRGRRRFSLAGAQDKVPVIISGTTMSLPDRANPSTHILKLETIRKVCFAEIAGSDLAARMGLSVVDAEYRELSGGTGGPFLLVERYDRYRDAEGCVRRLHQEDVAQALGHTSDAKYQEDGGPRLGDIAALLRRCTADPIESIRRLRDWQIFNYLLGNSDGHAKNLSLLYELGTPVPTLAPFYDLVCIKMLDRIGAGNYDRRMALFIGEQAEPERVTRDDWTALARSISVPPRTLLARLREMAERAPEEARATREAFAESFGDNQVYDRFEEAVRDRCGWTLRSVFGRG